MSQIRELTKVVSSNIEAMGFIPATQVMTVQFKNGKVYDYQNVSAETYDTIMKADSVGSTFNKLVKAQPSLYPFSEV